MTLERHEEVTPDFRSSRAGRRQSWWGLKRHCKQWLSRPVPHFLLRIVTRRVPALGRNGRLPAPAALREVTGSAAGAHFVMLRPDRCVVAKELYWGAGRRPRPEDDFAIQLFARRAASADTVVDIGAYTGIFTLAATAANRRVRVHAFEMLPDVHRALQENCERNGVADRVVLHREAMGAPGPGIMVPAGSTGSALADFYSTRLQFDSGVPVPMTTLDELADAVEGRVLMKVDVEGTENEVFRHGQTFLARTRPDILCEVLHGVADGAELQSLLAPHGYRFYLVRGADLLPSPRIEPDPEFRDWLFTTGTPEESLGSG